MSGDAAGDMTPMIDMVFLLIAFFTVLINFSEADQNQRIHLPSSDLAKPPDMMPESTITLQITRDKSVLIGASEYRSIEALRAQLEREKQFTQSLPGANIKRTEIILRSDGSTEYGYVQQVIKACQETGYDLFRLRAKQEQSASFLAL
jgi:biopolymer transport protein ExbD